MYYYNQSGIAAMEAELSCVNAEIPSVQKQLSSAEQTLLHQGPGLQTQISLLQRRLSALEAQQLVTTAIMVADRDNHSPFVSALETGMYISSTIEAGQVQTELSIAQQQYKTLVNNRNVLAEKINTLRSNGQHLEQQLQAAHLFQAQYQTPEGKQQLAEQLKKSIRVFIIDFETNHPAKQSKNSQTALNMLCGVMDDETDEQQKEEEGAASDCFDGLRATLWFIHGFVTEPNLKNLISQKLIATTHLPDNSARYFFDEEKRAAEKQVEELDQELRTHLTSLLQSNRPDPRKELATQIQTYLNSGGDDHKLYYRILMLLDRLYGNNDQSSQLLIDSNLFDRHAVINRLLLLAPHTQGTTSTACRISGAILALIGFAIIATSITISVASAGILSPLAYFGAVKGGLMVGSGVATLTCGAALFFHGREKGICKALKSLTTQNSETHSTAFNQQYVPAS